MTQPKLTLNLNEQNELAFKISIEGSSSDIDATKPKIRFLVSENGKDVGMIYPTKPGEDGFVVVNIPSSNLFSEEKSYNGKLEVILGNHYFVPTEVEMEFIKPLKVEAAVVISKETINETKTKENSVSVSSVQLRNKKGIESPKREKDKKKKWSELSTEEKTYIKKVLIRKKKKELLEAKNRENKKLREEQKTLKEQLKNLMSSSLLDD